MRIVSGVDREAALERERSPLSPHHAGHPIFAVLDGAPPRLLDVDDPDDEPGFGPPDVPTSARAMGIRSAVIAPIPVHGKVVGALVLGRGRVRPKFGEGDLDRVVDLARRIGLAWHNSLLLAERASILASLHDGLVVSDGDGAVIEVNERWLAMSGFTLHECIGARRPYPWWPPGEVDANATAELHAAADRAMRTGHVEERMVLQRADGSLFPALVSVAPMVDRTTGDARGLVASIKDLTLRESAQADVASLLRVSARLAAANDVSEVVAATLAEVVARTRADAAFLTRLSADGQQLAVVGIDGPLAGRLQTPERFAVSRHVPSTTAVRDGTTIVVRSGAELIERFPDVADFVAALEIESAVTTPVRRRGEAVGALSLWSTSRGAFNERDAAFVEAVAGQYGQALHRAEGYELEHRSSQALQRRLLSDVPVLHDRATIVTRYQPAASEVAVGGDWYDVMPLADDCVAVAVGDVVGSGVDAAAVMGQLRSALKGVALSASAPVEVLEALDRLAAVTAGAVGATVCYAVVDLAQGTVRFARAGHPPPLIVCGATGSASFAEGFADPPLGVGPSRHGHRRRRETTVRLASGDVLLLYTDGLVERRDTGLAERLELLRSAAATARNDSVEELVDDVLAACVGGEQLRDDLAVLALRDEPAGAERFRAVVPAMARELGPLRRGLRRWLLEAGVDERIADDVVLATSEAATNAVEHAYRDTVGTSQLLAVNASVGPDVVRCEVRDTGTWKARPSQTTRGRGLAIARALLDDVDIRSGPSGTTVLFRTSSRTRRSDRTGAR